MDIASMTALPFPRRGDVVYLIGVDLTERGFVPWHVGRFGDYVSGQFSACTDFRVHVVAQHLESRGHRVVIRYREVGDRLGAERELLATCRTQGSILNDEPAYDLRTADESDERTRATEWAETWAARLGG